MKKEHYLTPAKRHELLTFYTRLDQIATFSDASATSSAKFDEFAKSPDDLSRVSLKKTVELRRWGV